MQFEENILMSKLTTLQIGGPAKKFVSIKTDDELVEAITFAKENNLQYLLIGGGSNLLVSDQGVDALIIKNEITGIGSVIPGSEATPESDSGQGGAVQGQSRMTLTVKSGTNLQDLVDYTITHGLSGLHKMTGIPGTVGGAVYGNAGAYGQTIAEHISTLSALNPNNLTIQQFNNSDCNFNYRDSGFKRNHQIILEVTFQLESTDPQTLQQEADGVLFKRLIKYPKGIKCPGSFFKNIVADTLTKEVLEKIPKEAIVYGKLPAGYLLEQVGANGDSEDGISITPYHANLFVNNGSGTAAAFYMLAQMYAQKVKEKFGISLEPEVQLINLPTLIIPN